MDKMDCNVIRDLLPLYADGVASPETCRLIEAHLPGCPACRHEAEAMTSRVCLPVDPALRAGEAAAFRHLQKRLRSRRFWTALAALLCAFALMAGLYALAVLPRLAVPYDPASLTVTVTEGKVYAHYRGGDFTGTVTHDTFPLASGGETTQAVIFYFYQSPWDKYVRPLFVGTRPAQDHLLFLGEEGQVDAVYYGEFQNALQPSLSGEGFVLSGQEAELIWQG